MPTAGGPNTLGESNLVFAYDTGDTRNSYIGEPTTNIYSTDGYSFWQLNGNHTATRYTGNAPDLTTILNNYDYHTIVTTGNWSNEVDRALLWTNSGLLQLNTQYAVSFYARVISTSTANIGAAFYGNALPNSLTLTNQWQRFTVLTSTTATFRPFEFGSKSGAITFQVAGIQYEAKSHSTPYVNGTRSATQGLLPLIGNSTIDLTNVSFDSSAKMTFDGTNDYINVPYNTSHNLTSQGTVSAWINPATVTQGNFAGIVAQCTGGSANQQAYQLSWRQVSNAMYGAICNGSGTYDQIFASLPTVVNVWYNIVFTWNGSQLVMYNNGVVIGTATQTINNQILSTDLTIGGYTYKGAGGSGEAFNGKIDKVELYNKALTAQEIKQNYQQYKTRFNLS